MHILMPVPLVEGGGVAVWEFNWGFTRDVRGISRGMYADLKRDVRGDVRGMCVRCTRDIVRFTQDIVRPREISHARVRFLNWEFRITAEP